jgi:hypothetical protein
MKARVLALTMLAALSAAAGRAEVSMIEHHSLRNALKPSESKPPHPNRSTGAKTLIDNSGLEYFINTNITFSTTSSASAAMSEASYTHAVAATTLNGGTVASTLNDAFDGYNTLCLSLNNTVANCATGNANFVIYNKLLATATTECLGAVSGVNRQVVLPIQTSGNLQIQRKVFVPDNDSFARWLNSFTNTGGTSMTVTAVIANNLGSDSNTTVVSSSDGDATAEVTDTWVSSFQNYSGTTSSDPRLAHILQGPGATVPLTGINFVDGDDNPFWGYTFTLAPGETKILLNFVVGQPSKATAATKAASLTSLPGSALQCLSTTEQQEMANFTRLNIIDVPMMDNVGLLTLASALAIAALAMILKLR